MGEEQPLQAQQGADHVCADSLCLSFGLRPDLAVDVETCMAPAEDLLHKGKADELFPKQQGKDLMGENFLDNLVMETTDTMESTIRGFQVTLPVNPYRLLFPYKINFIL